MVLRTRHAPVRKLSSLAQATLERQIDDGVLDRAVYAPGVASTVFLRPVAAAGAGRQFDIRPQCVIQPETCVCAHGATGHGALARATLPESPWFQ